MIRIAKTIPERQPEFRHLNWWQRKRLGRYVDKTRCRRCGGVKVDQVARRFGYSPVFASRAVFGMGAFGLGFDCCCEEEEEPVDVTCGNCLDDELPQQFDITLTGFSDDNCNSCSSYNATFTLDYTQELGGEGDCCYALDFDPFCQDCSGVFAGTAPFYGVDRAVLQLRDSTTANEVNIDVIFSQKYSAGHGCEFEASPSLGGDRWAPSYRWFKQYTETGQSSVDCLDLDVTLTSSDRFSFLAGCYWTGDEPCTVSGETVRVQAVAL